MPSILDLKAKVSASDHENKADALTKIDALMVKCNIADSAGNASVEIKHDFLAKMADEIRGSTGPGEILNVINAGLKEVVLACKPILGLGMQKVMTV